MLKFPTKVTMKSKILAFGLCALALTACDTFQNQQASKPEVSIDANTTDDQKFSYMLGTQFSGPSFANIGMQLGEYFDVDHMVQGIYDNAKAQKDSTFKLQLTNDAMVEIDAKFAQVSEKRMNMARPDSATEMSFEGDISKLRAYVDSAMSTLPIAKPAPITNKSVTINEKTSDIQKYSYIMGTQLYLMFHGVEKQFEQFFDIDYFVHGTKEACRHVLDTSFVMQLSQDSIKAVNDRYVVKINELMKKRRAELMAQIEENAKKAVADSAAKANDSIAKANAPAAPAAEPAKAEPAKAEPAKADAAPAKN